MTDSLCSKCQNEPRIPGQRWGRGCRALYMRQWRKGADQRVFKRLLALYILSTERVPFVRSSRKAILPR